jgi:WD40 repeat protein
MKVFSALAILSFAQSFVVRRAHPTTTTTILFDSGSSSSSSSSSSSFMESLRARQQELLNKNRAMRDQWIRPSASSTSSLAFPDWVRRISVDYPLVACGSASSTIFVAHLETGKVLAASVDQQGFQKNQEANYMFDEEDEEGDDEPAEQDETLQKILRDLYGAYDGGGTLAIAMSGTLIVDAGRNKGVRLHRLDTSSEMLVKQGTIPALDNVLVTALQIVNDEYLWVGTADGRVQVYDSLQNLPLHTKPAAEYKLGSAVMSLDIHAKLACAVATTASGSGLVYLIPDIEDYESQDVYSFAPPFDGTERRRKSTFCLTATIVETHETETDNSSNVTFSSTTSTSPGYSIVCGANDGSIWVQPLAMDESGSLLNLERPFQEAMTPLHPNHFGPVKAMVSPIPNLVCSAGQDGTMRMWDLEKSKILYQFVGYKVWIGSLWSDGRRMISDGADNTVICHDYSGDTEDEGDL